MGREFQIQGVTTEKVLSLVDILKVEMLTAVPLQTLLTDRQSNTGTRYLLGTPIQDFREKIGITLDTWSSISCADSDKWALSFIAGLSFQIQASYTTLCFCLLLKHAFYFLHTLLCDASRYVCFPFKPKFLLEILQIHQAEFLSDKRNKQEPKRHVIM